MRYPGSVRPCICFPHLTLIVVGSYADDEVTVVYVSNRASISHIKISLHRSPLQGPHAATRPQGRIALSPSCVPLGRWHTMELLLLVGRQSLGEACRQAMLYPATRLIRLVTRQGEMSTGRHLLGMLLPPVKGPLVVAVLVQDPLRLVLSLARLPARWLYHLSHVAPTPCSR